MALSSEPAFPAKRIKCPVEADIDLLSSVPAKELSHWGKGRKGKMSEGNERYLSQNKKTVLTAKVSNDRRQ
jgi:hypothetical protein